MKRLLLALVLSQVTIDQSYPLKMKVTDKDIDLAAEKKCKEILRGEESNSLYGLSLKTCERGFWEGISWTEDYLIAAAKGKSK